MPAKVYRAVKFTLPRYKEIQELRDMLADERHNTNLSLPDAVSEAVKFYRESFSDPEEEEQ